MMMLIIGLVVALLIIVVIVNAIQQHKEKQNKAQRAKAAKQKAIINETEELILHLANLPSSPNITAILNQRSLNAAKALKAAMPDTKNINAKIEELTARHKASQELAANASPTEEQFILPDNDQQLIQILQAIKKLRVALKSEQAKGSIDTQLFLTEDKRLDLLQLKINVESLFKRGQQAYNNEMVGSARQYLEKALQSIIEHPAQSEYKTQKKAEIEEKLETISTELKNANAQDREKKAKSEENELDMLFQPKKKW